MSEHENGKESGTTGVFPRTMLYNVITKLVGHTLKGVDIEKLVDCTFSGCCEDISNTAVLKYLASTAGMLSIEHPDYALLGGRILAYILHENTPKTFTQAIRQLYFSRNPDTNKFNHLVSEEIMDLAHSHELFINNTIQHDRDYSYDYFGMSTLMRGYLLSIPIKSEFKIIERPQYLLMRVSLALYGDDLEMVKETYDMMSKKLYTHASPTLFNAGTNLSQLASCFLGPIKNDSIKGIYGTLADCAIISQAGGGLGISAHTIRGEGAYIKNINNKSRGLVPMMRVFNESVRYVNRVGNRRGAVTIYVEPWHVDIEKFIKLRKNNGSEHERTRDIFTALWIPDLFMQRARNKEMWSLMCPSACPGLNDVHGTTFEDLYTQYEQQGKFSKQIRADLLLQNICVAQAESGMPFMLYKDICNFKSNHKHLGTIQNSNLCTEIVQYSNSAQTAVCNLASISLPMFVCTETKTFDFKSLGACASVIVGSLDRAIDKMFYPTESAHISNVAHRPMGIGIQGLANTFQMLDIPFESDAARELNVAIAETIQFHAWTASCELAKKFGPYQSYKESPISFGVFQHDLWNDKFEANKFGKITGRYNWDKLRADIIGNGVRNSLCTAYMPTATTAQILGNSESFDPILSNLYVRRVSAGEFIIPNRNLVKKLEELQMWNHEMINSLKINNGSIQNIQGIPQAVKNVYKTAWEIPQKIILSMAAERGLFVDQSQSMNVYYAKPDIDTIMTMHFAGHQLGLKTGMYYLRSLPACQAVKFTIDTVCNINEEECNSCSI